jgi:O-antigen/teichoic acid export membrane protein
VLLPGLTSMSDTETQNDATVRSSGMRDLSITFGSRIVTILITLLCQSLLAWFLEPAGRGAYAVCVLFTTLLTILCVIGCDVASIYYVASKRMTLSQTIANATVHGGVGCFLAVMVGLIVLRLPIEFVNKATTTEFHLALVSLPLSFFSTMLFQLFGSLRAFGWMAVVATLGSVFKLFFIALFLSVLGWGVQGALLAMIIDNAVIIVMTMIVFYYKFGWRIDRPSSAGLRQMLSYGARYYFGKISNQMNLHVGAIILAFFATQEEIGLFAVAVVLASNVQIIPDTLTAVLVPRVAADESGRRDLVAQCARVTSIVCGVCLALLAIFAKPIVAIVFSPAFLGVVPLVRILAVGILVRSASKLFVPYMMGTDRPGVASMSVVVGLVTNVVTLYVFMPLIGLNGAALAMTMGYVASAIVLTTSFSMLSGMSFWKTWRYRRGDWTMVGQAIRKVRTRLMPVTQTEV